MRLGRLGFGIALGLVAATAGNGADLKIFISQTPSIIDEAAVKPWELGVKFQTSKAGKITAIRYYKAKSEAGAHTGRLWSAKGTGLAQVTFTGETGSGWQQAALAEPYAIEAKTTYVITVNANTHFVTSPGGLVKSISNPPLSTVEDGVNGLFGPMGIFPTETYLGNNYFRDLIFVEDDAVSIGKHAGRIRIKSGDEIRVWSILGRLSRPDQGISIRAGAVMNLEKEQSRAQ